MELTILLNCLTKYLFININKVFKIVRKEKIVNATIVKFVILFYKVPIALIIDDATVD